MEEGEKQEERKLQERRQGKGRERVNFLGRGGGGGVKQCGPLARNILGINL